MNRAEYRHSWTSSFRHIYGIHIHNSSSVVFYFEVVSMNLGPATLHMYFRSIDREIIFNAILSLLLIQVGQLSVTEERMIVQ